MILKMFNQSLINKHDSKNISIQYINLHDIKQKKLYQYIVLKWNIWILIYINISFWDNTAIIMRIYLNISLIAFWKVDIWKSNSLIILEFLNVRVNNNKIYVLEKENKMIKIVF